MNIWKILGIESTKDKDELKTAYRNKLTSVNPEDDAKGFMELRKAYEEALKLAETPDNEDMTEEDKDDDDHLTDNFLKKQISNVYRDLSKRVDAECWKKILNEDVFVALDTSEEALKVLLNFLMDHFLLPQNIWKLIIDTFYIKDRKKELCEKYPRDFIDFIIDNSENINNVNYNLFDDDIDSDAADDFLKKYLIINTDIRKGALDEAEEKLKELEDGDIYHPYIELAKIKIRLYRLTPDKDKDEIEKLYDEIIFLTDEYPEDFNFIVQCGDIATMLKEFEAAKEYYDKASELESGNYVMVVKYADLDYFRGDYEKSRDAYMELLRSHNYENAIRAGMLRANLALIEKYKAELKENPNDNNKKTELAWSFYQSYRFAEAVDILSDFEPSDEKVFEYYNVKGRSYLCLLDYDNALSCFYRWKDAIEALVDDGSQDYEKKKKRLPYVHFLIADCYIKTKKYDKAEEFLNIALATDHDEIILSYEALCELTYETGRYEECVGSCEKLIDYGDNNYIAYDYMSKAFYKLNYYKESISACEEAIRIYPYAADPYCQEIDVFLSVNQTETAKKIVEKYKLFNIPSDQIKLKEAEILMKEDKFEEAFAILEELWDVDFSESDLSDNYEVLNKLALCAEKTGRLSEACVYLSKIIHHFPKHTTAYGRLGMVYRKMKSYDRAITFFTKQINISPIPYFYFERAFTYRLMERYGDAIKSYELGLAGNSENAAAHMELGIVFEYIGDFEKAFISFENALKYEEDEEKIARLLINKARILQCRRQFKKAKEVYEQYIEKKGMDYDLLYDYSELLQRMDEADEAIKLLRDNISVITDDREEQILLRQLCIICGEEGYLNLANETFNIIISKYPNDHKAYKAMGDALKYQKLFDEAEEYYKKANELDFEGKENYYIDLAQNEFCKKNVFKGDFKNNIKLAFEKGNAPRNITDYIKLARIYRLSKKYKQAIAAIDDGLNKYRCSGCFYSACHDAYYEKGLIYEAMKKYAEARVCYNKARSIKGHSVLYEESIRRIEGK